MSQPSDTPPRRKGRWRRRLLRLAGALVLLALVLRLALPLALPSILNHFAGQRDLEVSYDKLDLSLLGGSFELWHLNVRPARAEGAEPAEPLAQLEFATVDADVSALFTGDFKVHRVEVDGLDLVLDRDAGGTWAIERYLGEQAEAEAPEAEAEHPDEAEPADEPRPFDLSLPFEIASVRLQHVRLHVRDASLEAPLDTHVELNLRVSDLGSSERPTRLQIQAHSPEVLDVLRVEGTGTSAGPALQAELAIAVGGLRPQPVAQYLEALGIQPHAEALSFSAQLAVDVAPSSPEALAARAQLALREVLLRADLEESLGIDELAVDVSELSTGGATVAAVELRGVRGRAERLASGVLRVAGLDLIGAPQAAEPEPDEPTAEGGAFPVELQLVRARELAFTFVDGGIEPAAELELAVDELSARNLVLDPARTAEVIDLSGTLRAPGIAAQIALEGQVAPFAPSKTFQLALSAEGLAPERLQPYLRAAGFESTLSEGALSASVQGRVETDETGALRAEVSLTDLLLVDGDERFHVERMLLDGLLIDPQQELVRVGLAELAGTRVSVHRDTERALHFLGLRTLVEPPASSTGSTGTPAAASADAGEEQVDAAAQSEEQDDAPTRFEVGRVAWTDTTLQLSDDALEPPLALTIDDLGLELEGFVLGGPSGGPARDPARLRLSGSARGVADELSLSGSIGSRPGPLDVDVDLALVGRGLTLEALQPYLAELGIESRLAGASLDLGIVAAVRSEPAGLRADLSLTALALENGGETPLALEALHVRDLLIAEDAIRIEAIDVAQPALRIARDAEGGLLIAGMRLPPPALEEPSDEPLGVPAARTAPPPAEAPQAGEPTAPMEIALGRFQLDGASFHWRDDAVAPAVDTALEVDGELTSLVFGSGAPSASFDLRLAVRDALNEMALRGTATLDPDDLRAQLELSMDGLRAGPLGVYLPEGSSVTLADGRLRGRVDAEVQTVAAGGQRVSLVMSAVDYRDGDSAEPLLELDSLTLDIPRFDLAGGELTVEELTSTGFEFSARRTGPTSFEALGFAFDPPGASAEPAPAEPAAGAGPDSGPPPLLAGALRRPEPDAELPTVRIERLDFGLERFHFVDETNADSAPFELGLRLTIPGPQTLLSSTPAELDPIELHLLGRAHPIAGDIDIGLRVSPYAVDPALELELDVRGIRGEGLTEVFPELAARLDGSGLPDGTLSGKLTSSLRVRRRSPTDFDFSSGFGLELDLEQLELRDRPDGDVLAGLDSIFVEVREIRPASGDVHVKTIELDTPRGLAQREPDGMRVLGLLLKNPPPPAEIETAEVAAAPEQPAPTTEVAAAQPLDGSERAPELRVDELLISGLDFEFRDNAVSPPTVLPFNDLEFEVKRFTTRALTEPVPIQFRAILHTGQIELPQRLDSTLVAGLFGAAAGALTGSADEFELEQRPAFGEIAASGRMVLYPYLKGFTKVDLRAIELVNFRGSALEAGVDLGDGLLDTEIDIRFRGEQGLSVDSRTTFSHLSVSEPPNGPISSYLKLPAPVDTVLFVLRDENEEQVIPLSFRVGTEGLSAGALTRTIVTTLGTVIGEALASSPMRIVGGVLDLAGLQQEEPLEASEESLVIDFAPGDTTFGPEQLAAAEPIFAAMRRDASLVLVLQHELGGGDLGQAARLSNPSVEDCLELAARLRQRKSEFLALRDGVAGEVRAQYAIGLTDAAAPLLADLRGLDRELFRTEAALDAIYELLRPGAERRQDRRTRAAGLAVAELRLDAARRALLGARVPKMPARIQVRRPRFEPAEGSEGGRITLTPLRRR